MKKLKTSKKTVELIYKQFKNCYISNINTVVDELDKNEQPTEKENIDLLKALIVENKALGQKQMYNFCIIGQILNCLKEKYGKKKYGKNNKEVDIIIKEVYGEEFGNRKYNLYSYQMRNFYIRLYKFALEYPKIMHVDISTITVHGVFNNWKGLKKLIMNDKNFNWK